MTTAFQSGAFQDDSFQIDAAAGGGTFAATETGSDSFAGTGKVIVQGTFSASESGADSFTSTGKVIVKGTLSASESGSDTFAATGTVSGAGGAVTGTMAASEAADVFGGYSYDYVLGDYVQDGVTGTVTGFVSRGGFRKGYIIKGKKYFLTQRELEQVIAQMLSELKRDDIVVDEQQRIIPKRAWKAIQKSIKSLDALVSVEPMLIEDEDDDEEALLMLL